MKLKNISIVVFLLLITVNVFGHKNGHGKSSKVWLIDNQPVVADFVKYEADKVYLFDNKHKLTAHQLSAFTPKDQNWIIEKNQTILSKNESNTASTSFFKFNFRHLLGYLSGISLLLFSILFYNKLNYKFSLTYAILGISLILFIACDNANENTEKNTNAVVKAVPANDLAFMNTVFGAFPEVKTNADDEFFHIASNGLPEHNMMVGITNWQQQVPINHDYTGKNSWSIPIQPKLSANPLSTKTNLLKGAIAVAVNGIPIFNPLNNRGEDANAIGELDEWGGHCGRADDYHYHLPPTHLQSTVGEGKPIAYAVDGFPVYGETEDELDEYLGKFNEDGSYQYHAVSEYPYLIAGMRGEVELDPRTSAPENQVLPQARTRELRPAERPLRGAAIIDFKSTGANAYSLTYTLKNENYIINYSWDEDGLYTYEFVNPDGTKKVDTYQR